MFDQQNDQHMLCQNVVQASFAQHLGGFYTTYVEWTDIQMLSGFGSTCSFSLHNICCAKLVLTQHLLYENVDPNGWNNILINISQSRLSSVLNVVQSPDVVPKCWSMWVVQHFTQHMLCQNVVQTILYNILTQHMLIIIWINMMLIASKIVWKP